MRGYDVNPHQQKNGDDDDGLLVGAFLMSTTHSIVTYRLLQLRMVDTNAQRAFVHCATVYEMQLVLLNHDVGILGPKVLTPSSRIISRTRRDHNQPVAYVVSSDS
jgi:hypothetical protein